MDEFYLCDSHNLKVVGTCTTEDLRSAFSCPDDQCVLPQSTCGESWSGSIDFVMIEPDIDWRAFLESLAETAKAAENAARQMAELFKSMEQLAIHATAYDFSIPLCECPTRDSFNDTVAYKPYKSHHYQPKHAKSNYQRSGIRAARNMARSRA